MNRNRILSLANEFLENEEYGTDYLYKYIDASIEAKQDLAELFSHHPNWNDEMGWIHFQYDTERKIDADVLSDFYYWVCRQNFLSNPSEMKLRDDFLGFLRVCTVNNNFGQFPTGPVVAKANELLKIAGRGHVTSEVRTSKIVNRVAKAFALDKIVSMRKESWYDNGGEYHEREKDYGWNYQFARFCDGINPLMVRRHTLLSLCSVDYLTMSNGSSWESCHDIRNADDPGCYSAGTMSYGMDPVSFIFYYVDAEYPDDADFCVLPKQKRCVFAWDGKKLLQSRVYPDGRDGGDFGLAEEVRSITQKVLADCLDIPNLWDLKKGTDTIRQYIQTCGYQYPDYIHYDDCTTSWPKAYGEHDMTKLKIGKYGICPNCGCEADQHENILCSRCKDGYDYHCDRCGDGFSEYNDEAVHVGDYSYCCAACAEEDGWRYCFDDEEWHSRDNVYYDDYREEYFYDDYYIVITEEGRTYYDAWAAQQDGNVYCEDDELWHVRRDCTQGHDGLWYYYEEGLAYIDGEYYTEDEAEDAGYIKTENGEWILREEEEENEAVSENSQNDAAAAEEVAA